MWSTKKGPLKANGRKASLLPRLLREAQAKAQLTSFISLRLRTIFYFLLFFSEFKNYLIMFCGFFFKNAKMFSRVVSKMRWRRSEERRVGKECRSRWSP